MIMKNKKKNISGAFRTWLLILVVIAFLATTAFLWISQTKISQNNAVNLLKLNISDVREDIIDASDANLLKLAHKIADDFNNADYHSSVITPGMQITLLNNGTDISNIPVRYDLREVGLVSPVKNQGSMGACWTFGMTGTLESALLKATGLATDLSENNMQDTMLKYSIYGCPQFMEGGANIVSTGYLLSWLGAFIQDADTYDEMGKLSPLITTQKDIHVQDLMFIPNNEIPNGTQLNILPINAKPGTRAAFMITA